MKALALLARLAIVFVVYAVVAFTILAINSRDSMSNRWSSTVSGSLAAGLTGVLAWAVICRPLLPGVWRTLFTGAAAGALWLPLFILAGVIYHGDRVKGDEFVVWSVLFTLVFGVITIPAGIVTAFVCRLILGLVKVYRGDAARETVSN